MKLSSSKNTILGICQVNDTIQQIHFLYSALTKANGW
jgi:hypothetical protein